MHHKSHKQLYSTEAINNSTFCVEYFMLSYLDVSLVESLIGVFKGVSDRVFEGVLEGVSKTLF